ncbi:MAG: serine/threonine-protein kinase, partial [Bryobacterales bacterium]|nr:serine/threonine-protein kinase [Bryobacterales bacterium]
MVLELIEGETLAARIEKGALPLAQALQYAVQIADALDRAHRAGVTHRDVKPQNIMLTRDGVKVLDFGLAKSTAKPAPKQETLTAVLTTEGTVLGTPQYMAPEQFEGKEADARSDIWAFGAVLYEMVTGRKAFQGKSYSSLVGAILSADPAPMAVKPFTPAWLERLVRRCLEKDPEDRWQAMRDIVLELRSPVVESAAPVKSSRWGWVAAAVALVAALGWTAWQQKPREASMPVALDVNPPQGVRFAPIVSLGGSAISPDGRTLAFVTLTAKGETLLHVRPLESLEARALPGTEGAGRPFWSPDSKSLAFFARGQLKRIDVGGGSPITLCDTAVGRGGMWSEDGFILFTTQYGVVQRIPASGGTPTAVTKLDQEAGESAHHYPQLLPGGRQFLYLMRHAEPEKSAIFAGSLDGKPATKIVQTLYKAAYDAGSGRLLYIQGNGTLMARRLELDPPRLSGDPVVVAEGVGLAPPNGFANFSVSANGTLFYGQLTMGQKVRFAWRDRKGKVLGTIGDPVEGLGSFRLSPDESKVAYSLGAADGQLDIWILELARGVSTRFTFGRGHSASWSPDGKHVYYTDRRAIHRKASDGSGEAELVWEGLVSGVLAGVSPDGRHLLYTSLKDIWKLPLTGERKPEPYLQTKFAEQGWAFSPDGRWVVYQSNESGRAELYVQGFPERRGKWQVSAGGGSWAAWRADGKELYWVSNGTLMAASVNLQGAAVQPGKPEPLFPLANFGTTPFAPARDGQRFLVLEPDGGEQPDPPMVVVQNYAARLGK